MHVLSLRNWINLRGAIYSSIFFLGFSLLFLGVSCYYWRVPSSSEAAEVTVIFDKGMSVHSMANRLADQQLLRFPKLFVFISRILLQDRYFYAGEYVFRGKLVPADIYRKLAEGDIFYRKVTFPEGWSLKQIASRLIQEEALAGDIPEHIKEGYLLPDTYHFVYGDKRSDVVERMERRMADFIQKAWKLRDKDLPFTSVDEALVLASIVEKEAAVESERELIAAVFINRLKRRMRLQADPTVIYALSFGDVDGLGRLLTKKDLQIDSRYNTYRYAGLPPTPIANPGVASILAVLHPAESDDLYFVANGNGGHNFASTLKSHNKNVKAYRKMR